MSNIILDFLTSWQSELVSYLQDPSDNALQSFLKTVSFTLPILGLIASFWITLPCLISLLFRKNRDRFLSFLIVTWWDLIRSIYSFWGGLIRLVFFSINLLFSASRIFTISFIGLMTDSLITLSKRYNKNITSEYFQLGKPWPTIILTFLSILFESLIITLTSNAFLNGMLSQITKISIPTQFSGVILFFTFIFFTYSSYIIQAITMNLFRKRQFSQFFLYSFLGIVTFMVQIAFLYIDLSNYFYSWLFNQNIINQHPSLTITILTSSIIWLTIRTITWTMYANRGAIGIYDLINQSTENTSNAIILVPLNDNKNLNEIKMSVWIDQLKIESEWFRTQLDKLIFQLITPPMQIIGAIINFVSLLLTTRHLFELPFDCEKDLPKARELMQKIKKSY